MIGIGDALEELVVLEVERLDVGQRDLRVARAVAPLIDELATQAVEELAAAPVVQVVVVHLALDALVHRVVHERSELELRRAHVRRTDAQAQRERRVQVVQCALRVAAPTPAARLSAVRWRAPVRMSSRHLQRTRE